MPLRVLITPTHLSSTGYRYETLVDGDETPIVRGSRDPEPDTCRMLLARGHSGPVQFYWRGGKDGLYVHDLVAYAQKKTREDRRSGPTTVKWTPFDKAE